MVGDEQSTGQSGGVNITGSTVNVGGDITGRDKTTRINYGELAELREQFEFIQRTIDQIADTAGVDKSELKSIVQGIEQEVTKGEIADKSKVERWLKSLAEVADDVFQITVATLANPAVGVAKAIQLVAQRATR